VSREELSGALPKDVDRYVLVVRWGVIVATGMIYVMSRPSAPVVVNPIAALLGIIAYSLPISAYEYREYPIARGNPWWLILGDTVFSLVAVMLTGGHTSAFFLLFLLVMIEAALGYRWRLALSIVVAVDALQLAASTLYQTGSASPFIVVNRFVALLVFGIFAILFGENARREEAERKRMEIAAAHERNLNEIFLKLGESSMNLERVLNVILESAQRFLNASCAMVLLRDEATGKLQVAASSTPIHPTGQVIERLTWQAGDDQTIVTEKGQPDWPDFAKNDQIRQLIGVRLLSRTEKPLGWVIVGRDMAEPLAPFSRNLIRALALEAGFAVHNAWLYEREQQHIRRLERFKDTRSTFFSALGHELKTPLTVLKTLAPSLERLPELPPETRQEIVDSIRLNLDRLEMLITEMLESARLEADAVSIYPTRLDLRQRVEKDVEAVMPVFDRKEVDVNVDIPEDLPPVMADPRRVDQILFNLLSNAAKFAPPGSEVRVVVFPADGQVGVCVEDAGPGVPPEDREKIFDKFYIASRNQALAGVGLGLFISRELVRLHGGRIWLEDSDLGGSRFCFTLPAVRTEGESGESNPKDFGDR